MRSRRRRLRKRSERECLALPDHQGRPDDRIDGARPCRARAPTMRSSRSSPAAGWASCTVPATSPSTALVAIKIIRPDLATAGATERFLREARALASFNHPNIVPVHRAGESQGLPYYVMDYVEGATLADRLAIGPLPTADALRLADDLLGALEAVQRPRPRPPRHQAAQHFPLGRPRGAGGLRPRQAHRPRSHGPDRRGPRGRHAGLHAPRAAHRRRRHARAPTSAPRGW